MKKRILRKILVMNLMIVFFSGLGCGSGKKEDKPLTNPLQLSLSKSVKKVHGTFKDNPQAKSLNIDDQDTAIYGKDDRLDYYQVDMDKKKAADSTVLLTDRDKLNKNGDGSYSLSTEKFYFSSKKPCNKEPYYPVQNVGGWCSGFLVGSDLIATAGHCVESDEQAEKIAFVFGFRMENADTQVTQFDSNRVYWGKKLISQELNQSIDYAIIQLDREVTTPDAKILKVRRNGSANNGVAIGVIGYPSGLPVKVGFGNNTFVNRHDGNFLLANLDTYGGNSGSAVFDKNAQLVEGILVRGKTDFEVDTTNDCYRSVRYENAAGSEWVTKADVFKQFIPE